MLLPLQHTVIQYQLHMKNQLMMNFEQANFNRLATAKLRSTFSFLFGKISLPKTSGLVAILLILASFQQSQAQQITDRTVFPLNDYLYTTPDVPYPKVNETKVNSINTSRFVNVMDYGAKGDGQTYDDQAIVNAFKNAQYGVIFPAGKTFLVSKISKVTLTHDLTVYAYGATIKMGAMCAYSFLSLKYQSGSYHNNVIWLGGTLDGNQYNQIWPGNPHGGKYNGGFVETHGRFLGVSFAEFVMFKDINVINTVVDGPTAESCKLAVFSNSKASGGAPYDYQTVGEQGTYFKSTREGMKTTYFLDLECTGGSIGTHLSYPTNSSMDNSILSVHVNCKYSNQAQDAIHIEDCYKNFFYNCSVSADGSGNYKERIHLSNRSGVVAVKNCQFTNAYVNFNQASNLRLGLVDNCTFLTNKTGLRTFLDGKPHLCTNNTFSGKCSSEQADASNVRNCTFTNFGSKALTSAYATDGSQFVNGNTPVTTASNGFLVNCTFQQVTNTSYRTSPPSDNNWKQVFNSYIDVYSDNNVYLGRINCGSGIGQNRTGAESKSALGTTNSDDATFNTSMRVYPNPATDLLHVTLNEKFSGKTVLSIYDQQGRMVQSKTISKNTTVIVETMDVKNLSAGTYILKIANTDVNTSFEFIVAR